MTEAYYPRHSELDTAADVQADALQARVRQLETLLREVADNYVGWCTNRCECTCIGRRIEKALGAKS